jgi:hypothetical protein
MLGQLETGVGFWNAIIWLISFIVIGISIYGIRALGKAYYKKGTEQVKPFLSGAIEYDTTRVPGENVYWGFLQALKNYYGKILPVHRGVVSDYIFWLVLLLVLLLIIVTLSPGG